LIFSGIGKGKELRQLGKYTVQKKLRPILPKPAGVPVPLAKIATRVEFRLGRELQQYSATGRVFFVDHNTIWDDPRCQQKGSIFEQDVPENSTVEDQLVVNKNDHLTSAGLEQLQDQITEVSLANFIDLTDDSPEPVFAPSTLASLSPGLPSPFTGVMERTEMTLVLNAAETSTENSIGGFLARQSASNCTPLSPAETILGPERLAPTNTSPALLTSYTASPIRHRVTSIDNTGTLDRPLTGIFLRIEARLI